ncbi:MAG TPA: glycosyltransferase family 4 protein [Saprospiraceae bacterium]|nr:glycosyltransferase family 4 protein [Saprospiraceae bacterium]
MTGFVYADPYEPLLKRLLLQSANRDDRMKVLFLCKKFPYPLKDGESIAISNLCKELKTMGCDITLLCMNTSKHYMDPGSLPPEYDYFTNIHAVELDNSIKPWKAFASIVSGESYHIRRFKSSLFRAKLIQILNEQKFDIIQLETLYLAPYVDTIRRHSEARIVMRAHNVEHEIWERITQNTGSNLKKWYLAYLTRKLRQYEIEQFPVYDYLVTLTERDLNQFREKGYKNGASAAPIGFDPALYPYTPPSFGKAMSLCFIGSLDWMPNMEGLEWFLANCWQEIHKKWPKITFHIAGRNTPMSLLERRLPNVIVHGEVADAAEFISKHSAMIVPLFSGSGMRVKIVEGMVMGKVIITTSLGKEGIEGQDKQHFLLANKTPDFIEAIRFCIEHPETASQIGLNAISKASEQFEKHEAARQIMEIYQSLMSYHQHPAENTLAENVSQ